MQNKKGFTLAEIMIAMATLGVIAAIVVPTLSKFMPDSNKIMARKAYYTLEQVINDLINDEAEYPSTEVDAQSTPRGFNFTTKGATTIPASTSKFCYLFTQQMNTIGNVSCSSSGNNSFTSSDGINWMMQNTTTFTIAIDNYDAKIGFDVNGSKDPNCFESAYTSTLFPSTGACTAGKKPDRYEFGIRYDGRIQALTGTSFLTSPTEFTR